MRKLGRLLLAREDTSRILDALEDIEEADLPAFIEAVPELVRHESALIRAETIEMIGVFGLRIFSDFVRGALADAHADVKAYALTSWYELMGRKAMPEIQSLTQDADEQVRAVALAVTFVETEDMAVLEEIRRLVTAEGCDYHVQYAVLHTWEHYLDLNTYPEVLDCLTAMRTSVCEESGIAQDLDGLFETFKDKDSSESGNRQS